MSEAYEFETDADIGMDEEEVKSIITSELDDAIDFIDNTISPVRAMAEKYYLGEEFGNEEEGRSQVVSMDVRDTIQGILPSLMRIFTGGEHIVEFAPHGPEDTEIAKQATDYCNYIFMRDNPGFSVLFQAFKDSLMKKVGFIKFYWDVSDKVEGIYYTGLTEEALNVLNSEEEVSLDEIEMVEENDEQGNLLSVTYNVRGVRITPEGRIKIEAVPPEEFLISRNAKDLETAELVAHRRYLTLSELVEMGYDYDDVEQHVTNETEFDFNPESEVRNPSLSDMQVNDDPTMRRALYIESYVKMDVDGDNRAELRKICTIGEEYEVYRNTPCDAVPFATFMCDPEPHTFFGLSVADLTADIQRIKSSVLRSTLDSLALSVHQRVAFVEGQANVDDLLNTEIGGVIRMRSPGAVQPFNMPFVGKEAYSMLEYMDLIRENRTGVSRAADGLDPSALQSSTQMAVAQTISAAQQRTELIARLFAEDGMKRLFEGIYRLVVMHQDSERMVKLRNEFVPIDPRYWTTSMDVVANVGLGRGTEMERMAMLRELLAKQEQILAQLGPVNPLVGQEQYYSTLTQLVELAGFKDTTRFFTDPANFNPPPPEPPKPDINEQLIQVQMADIQSEMERKMADLELQYQKMQLENDRLRDKQETELMLKVAEIEAKYGTQLDVANIRALAERDRALINKEAFGG
jgi:hypothetical protein